MPSFAQMAIWCSLALIFVKKRARSSSLTIRLDADLLPLLLDHLGDLRVGDEGPRRRLQLDAQPPLAVRPQPVALTVLLRQADLVQQLVGLLRVVRGPLLPPLGSRAVRRAVCRDDGAGDADPEPEGLVELVAVDAEGERPAEVPVVQPLRDLGIRLVGMIDLQRGVGAVQRRVEADVVVALAAVLQEDGELRHGGVPLLQVVLPGDGAEVQDLQVLGQRPC